MRTRAVCALDTEHRAFIQSGVSIVASSSGEDLRPTLARAAGCRVGGRPLRITLFFAARHSHKLRAALTSTDRIAVVFSEVASHRTIQIKGGKIRIEPLGRRDLAAIAAYRDAFVAAIGDIGYPTALVDGLLDTAAAEYLAASFEPREIFGQTPGPRAGEPLRMNP